MRRTNGRLLRFCPRCGNESRLHTGDSTFALAAAQRKLRQEEDGVSDRYGKLSASVLAAIGLGLAGAAAASAEDARAPIRVGQSIEGELAPGDKLEPDGTLFDSYAFDGKAGQMVSIEMSSRQLDSYLGLFVDGQASPIAYNDNAARRGRDARLDAVLPKDGRYIIVANTVQVGEAGAYRLTLKPGRAIVAERPRAKALASGKAISGALGERSGRAPDNSLYDLYRYRGKAGETVRISLSSVDFDAFVSLHRPGEERDLAFARNRGARNAELTYTLPKDGDYEIWANTSTPGEVGRYTLRLDRAHAGAPAAAKAIAYGDTVRGELDASDPKAHDGSYYDLYQFKGARGDEVTITMRSPALESFLSVRPKGAAGDLATAADDGLGGRDAELTFVLPQDGVYDVWANTLGADERGQYLLAIEKIGRHTGEVAENPPKPSGRTPS